MTRKPDNPHGHDAPRDPRTDVADDPRLTAYALGELDGADNAADRAEIEALLARDPAARDAVAQIREFAVELTHDLAAEAAHAAPVSGLTLEQRRDIEHELRRAAAAAMTAPATASPTLATATTATASLGTGTPTAPSRAGGSLRWLRFAPALAAGLLIAVLVWQDSAETARGPSPSSNVADVKSTPVTDEKGDALAIHELVATDESVAQAPLKGMPYVRLPAAADSENKLGVPADQAKRKAETSSSASANPAPDAALAFELAAATPEAVPANGDALTARQLLESIGYVGRGDSRENELSGRGRVSDGTSPSGAASPGSGAASGESAAAIIGIGGASHAPPRAATGAGKAGARTTGRGKADRPPSTGTPAAAEAGSPLPAQVGYLGGDTPAADAANALAFDVDDRDHDSAYRYFRTPPGGEGYEVIVETGFLSPLTQPLSTFSVDVDTASYANVRRFLNAGQAPPADAVRIEELLNYFHYDYPQPEGSEPFSVTTDVTSCPWAPSHRLVRIGLQGRSVPQAERAPSNLVFLVDVSGSMDSPDKLPLVQASLRLLVGKLDARDRIAIVVYAGNAGLVLPSTNCAEKQPILDALDRLSAGGSTAGGAGIALAYQVAAANFIKGGTNRVILATDGDFNVGATSRDELQALIERSAKTGVFLTVLGYGTGNLQDGTAELLADKGNGNYAYIDSLAEAQKVLVAQMGGTLITIAKDVKLQVEFNPGRVGAYRLIGYENRALAARDFNDDKKDAGEIGSGHSVTALYEVIPVGVGLPAVPAVDALKYQQSSGTPGAVGGQADDGQAGGGQAGLPAAAAPELVDSPELLTVKLRSKQPDGDTSQLLEHPLTDSDVSLTQASPDLKFAAAVASFGMLLRRSGNAGDASFDSVIALAEQGRGADSDGYRAEFIRLVRIAQSLLAPNSGLIDGIGYVGNPTPQR